MRRLLVDVLRPQERLWLRYVTVTTFKLVIGFSRPVAAAGWARGSLWESLVTLSAHYTHHRFVVNGEMHPGLRVSNLDRLPIAIRRIAKALIASPPSTETLQRFLELSQRPEINLDIFLPAFYVQLDPLRLPPIDALEDSDDDTYGLLRGVVITLQAMTSFEIPMDMFPDLWPRMSTWCDFLFVHEEFLSTALNLGSLDRFWLCLLSICGHISNHAPNKSIILSTPRFCVLAARAYRCFCQTSDFVNESAFYMICQTFIEGRAGLEEVLEGISGTVSDLARLIMRQCEVGVPLNNPEPCLEMAPNKTAVLELAFQIVGNIDHVDGRSHAISSAPLCLALVPLGFIKTLIVALRGLSSRPLTDGYPGYSLALLVSIFERDVRRETLKTAVLEGLLDTLVAVSSRLDEEQLSSDVSHCLDWLILELLAPSTIYYDLVSEMQKSSLKISPEVIARTPSKNLATALQLFVRAIRERFQAFGSFESETTVRMSVCGNQAVSNCTSYRRGCIITGKKSSAGCQLLRDPFSSVALVASR
ncbi:hypothetical protein R3P38DRAFT_800560 [Favolaschia claudopus]|uniref:Uncharacterized protein n=1 Tax=Favolaschia claudopus TaxID=2862362 RepID=A0AAV9Z431_9AGAR